MSTPPAKSFGRRTWAESPTRAPRREAARRCYKLATSNLPPDLVAALVRGSGPRPHHLRGPRSRYQRGLVGPRRRSRRADRRPYQCRGPCHDLLEFWRPRWRRQAAAGKYTSQSIRARSTRPRIAWASHSADRRARRPSRALGRRPAPAPSRFCLRIKSSRASARPAWLPIVSAARRRLWPMRSSPRSSGPRRRPFRSSSKRSQASAPAFSIGFLHRPSAADSASHSGSPHPYWVYA